MLMGKSEVSVKNLCAKVLAPSVSFPARMGHRHRSYKIKAAFLLDRLIHSNSFIDSPNRDIKRRFLQAENRIRGVTLVAGIHWITPDPAVFHQFPDKPNSTYMNKANIRLLVF